MQAQLEQASASYTTHPGTVFVAAEQGFEARYLLRSSLFHELRTRFARVVLLVPNPDEPYMREEFNYPNVVLAKYQVEQAAALYSGSKVQRALKIVRSFGLDPAGNVAYLDDKTSTRVEKRKSRLVQGLLDRCIWLVRRSRVARRGLIALESRAFCPSFHKALFEHYRPVLLITPSPGYQPHETYLIREAKRRGVKAVAVLAGWDSSTSRGLEGAFPDRVVVWSDIMKEEMVKYHNIREGKLFVGGVPPFDLYFQPNAVPGREAVFAKYGLDPNKKLLVFGTKSPLSYPNFYVVELLAKAIQEDRLVAPCQLLVRLHPIHHRPDLQTSGVARQAMERYQAVQRWCPSVTFSVPQVKSDKLKVDMGWEEMVEVASLLKHTDVLVTLFSTLVVEAALTDTPVVNVCFDPPQGYASGRFRPIMIDRNQPQNLRTLDLKGTRVAYSPEEMIATVNLYLQDRSQEKEQRGAIAAMEAGPTDGASGKRVVDYIAAFLSSSRAR